MAGGISRGPIIFFPHTMEVGRAPGSFFPATVNLASNMVTTGPISTRTAARIAVQHPALVQRYMMDPHDGIIQNRLGNVLNGLGFDADARSADIHLSEEAALDRFRQDVTRLPEDGMERVLSELGKSWNDVGVQVLFDPAMGYYRVYLTNNFSFVEDVTDRILKSGLSTLGMSDLELSVNILSNRSDANFIHTGGIAMLMMGGTDISAPKLFGVSSHNINGVKVQEFYSPYEGQRAPSGSSIAVSVTPDIRARLTLSELLDALAKKVEEARAKGKRPAIAVDLDGTLMNARGFTAKVFFEWLKNYDGRYADEIREVAEREGFFDGWDSPEILKHYLKFMPDMPEVDQESALLSARAHFDGNFFSADRRVDEMGPITGTVELLKAVQSMGVDTVFVTLRSERDDNTSDGRIASVEALKRFGLWNGSSTMLRHRGDRIIWSSMADPSVKRPEPKKTDMIEDYRKDNPGVWFIAAMDNDVRHNKTYQDHFKGHVVNIHVQGDTPFGAPSLPSEGILTISPDQLSSEMKRLLDGVAERITASSSQLRDLYSDYKKLGGDAASFSRLLAMKWSEFSKRKDNIRSERGTGNVREIIYGYNRSFTNVDDHKGRKFRIYAYSQDEVDSIVAGSSLLPSYNGYATASGEYITHYADLTGVFITTPSTSSGSVGVGGSRYYVDFELPENAGLLRFERGLYLVPGPARSENADGKEFRLPIKVVGSGRLGSSKS